MRSPVKGGTIQTKILDCLAEPKPLEPASSPMIAAILPDMARDGIPFVEDERTEIGIEKNTMEHEMEQNRGMELLEADGRDGNIVENIVKSQSFATLERDTVFPIVVTKRKLW